MAHHHQAQGDDEKDHDLRPGQSLELNLIKRRLRERIVSGERHPGCRRREPREIPLVFRPSVDREAGQAEDHAHRERVREDPGKCALFGEQQEVHEDAGRDAEADEVYERIQLRSERRSGLADPRRHPVQQVEDTADADPPTRAVEVSLGGEDHRPESEEQIGEREETGHDHHHAPYPSSPTPSPLHACRHSAKIVLPANARSPTRTRTRAPTGTNVSTRDPNRMRPNRSPCSTVSPSS